MPSTSLAFASAAKHRAWLEAQSALPAGFRIGTAGFAFTPSRRRSRRAVNLTLLALRPTTPAFALKLTRKRSEAPIVIGRARRDGPCLGRWW